MMACGQVTFGQFVLLLALGSVFVFALPDSEIQNNNCIGPLDATGHCEKGCKTGFYGLYCNETCSGHCDAACSQGTGNCLTGCDPAWFKSNCSRNCIGHCINDICDIRSGDCIRGCIDGFYGPACDKRCSENCTGGVCDEFGGCSCKKGVKDTACYVDCTDNCKDGQCASDSSGQPTCLAGCQAGRTGRFCQEWCPSNCSKCDSKGVCIDGTVDRRQRKRDLPSTCCTDGRTGNACSTECPNCIYSKSCIPACEGGYFGDQCHLNCSDTCSKGTKGRPVCTKDSGKCHSGCLQGYHGFSCRDHCSVTCLGRRCFQDNSSCVECEPRKYGAKCEYDCGECIEDKCGRNGTCNCKPGWYGLRCQDKCSDKCKTNDCRVDIRGNHVCVGECVNGYTGDDCLEECPSGCKECDRREGTCHSTHNDNDPDSNSLVVTAIVLAVIAIVAVIVVVVILLWKKKKISCPTGKPKSSYSTSVENTEAHSASILYSKNSKPGTMRDDGPINVEANKLITSSDTTSGTIREDGKNDSDPKEPLQGDVRYSTEESAPGADFRDLH